MSCRTRVLVLSLAVAVLVGCRPDQETPAAPSLASTHLVQSLVGGSMRGPDGTSVCNFVAPGSVLTVRTVPMIPFVIAGPTQTVFCPTDTYSFLVDSGDYRIRITLPVSADLPWRWLEPGVVSVDGSTDITKDIQVMPGQLLGGGASIDGSPLAGVGLTLLYGVNPAFGAAVGTTGAAGTWEDNLGRSFLPLQTNEQYSPQFFCNALGATPVLIAPLIPFIFPSEASNVDCQLGTSAATQFTNSANRMVVTAFPGDIGGLSGAFLGTLGSGWGVQFPLSGPPAHIPFNATHLFLGGLMIASDPAHILTGFDAAGELQCTTCQDMGLDGIVRIDPNGPSGNTIEWRYSDALSPEGLGLSVTQHSLDNPGGADYILYRYAISNTSGQKRTFFAGFFGDWDIDQDPTDDIGDNDLDGRLLYMTNGSGVGTHAGTLVVGAPVAGRYFFPLIGVPPPSPVEQSRAMNGDIQVPSFPCCTDIRYIQSVGPITLQKNGTRVIWVAVVLGDDKAQLLTNAIAASAEIQVRAAAAAPVVPRPATVFTGAQLQARKVPTPRKPSFQ